MATHPLKQFVLSRAEDRPGVYRWLGADGRILYVGKSVRLRSRLLSYFREPAGKLVRLMAEATDVAWDYVPNEFAAVFREVRLIRAWRPEYNVEHKRKPRAGFVKLTQEPAPRLSVVSRVLPDRARYYGPFGATGWVARAVHDLSRATGLRDCPGDTPMHFGDQLEIFAAGRVPLCLRGEVGTCLAPCAGRCTSAEYDKRLKVARAFLEARSRTPLDQLSQQQAIAADRLDFEYAARLRDRMARLERLQAHLAGFRGQAWQMNLVYPVVGFQKDHRIYLIRRGRLHSEMPRPATARGYRRAAKVVEQVFRPALADRDSKMGSTATAETLLTIGWFRQRPEERKKASSPARWLSDARRAASAPA